MTYLWIKALHVAVVVAWAAGIVLAPVLAAALSRLQTDARPALGVLRQTFHRLASPALALTWALGLYLAVSGGWMRFGWLVGKVGLVLLLTLLHGAVSGWLRRGETLGEVPGRIGVGTLVALGLVAGAALLVILKPVA